MCGSTFTDDKVHNISAIKVKPKVKNELFEADETDVHPKKICQTCNRKVDGIDKAYRASLKNKTRYGEYNFDKEKEKMATFDKHTSDCNVCRESSRENPTDENNDKNNELSENEENEESPEIIFRDENPRPSSTQPKLSMRYVKKRGNIISHEKLECGNEAIKPKYFVDHDAAKQLSCTICKWFPKSPVLLEKCGHIYCKECLTNIRRSIELKTCYGRQDDSSSCHQKLETEEVKLSGALLHVWRSMTFSCKQCGKKDKIFSETPHSCKAQRRSKVRLPTMKDAQFEKRYSQTLARLRTTSKRTKESPASICVKAATFFLKEEKKSELKEEASELLRKIEDPNYNPQEKVKKLTPEQQNAMRIYTKQSIEMQQKQRKYLQKVDEDNRAKGFHTTLNILSSYTPCHKVDMDNCASNIQYTIKNEETQEEETHEAKISKPFNITEDFDLFGPGHPRPNMVGSAIRSTDATAHELDEIKEDIEKAFKTKVHDDETVEEEEGSVVVVMKVGCLTCAKAFKTTNDKQSHINVPLISGLR